MPLHAENWDGSILVQERGYVSKQGKALKAEGLSRKLTAFLGRYFPRYLDIEFTASLETLLDGNPPSIGITLVSISQLSQLWRIGPHPHSVFLDAMQEYTCRSKKKTCAEHIERATCFPPTLWIRNR